MRGANDMQFTTNKEQMALLLGCGVAIGLILFAVFAKFSTNATSMNTFYENILEEKKVLSQMRIHLLKSVEMEKSAVMALTDLESMDYASQSRTASAAVNQNLAVLRSLTDAMPMQNEKKLIDEFASCWEELGKVDQIILQLAVENTNLKAAALSREKATEIMQRFEQDLKALRASSLDAPKESQVAELTFQALISGLKMYNLHSPHIIEADNEKMDQFEARMKAEETEVTRSLEALTEIVTPDNRDTVTRAKTDFAEFTALTAEIVQLSRQNSNIKSLELSMGRKRKIVAKCDDALAVLQETMQNKTIKATK
jgi:hypothetical protein